MIILIYLILSIAIILFLSAKLKVHPALSLVIGSIFLGFFLKMNTYDIFNYLFNGFYQAVKGIGLIILFSCVIGQFLKESGSIERFGNIILKNLQKKTLLSINMLGLFIGTVVFCDSAFLILNGISKSIASSTSYSLTSLNLSLAGGLYTSHTLIPPTPGPLAAINNLQAMNIIGDIMIFGILVSIPSSLISFFYARKTLMNRNISIDRINIKDKKFSVLPYLVIVIPLLLISLNTITNFIENESFLVSVKIIKYFGNPSIALFIGMVLSFMLPDTKNKEKKIVIGSLNDFLPILLLTSMGSAFGNIIKNSELSTLLPSLFSLNQDSLLYICLISFMVSFILKTSQGSSTSAMIITSSIIFPFISNFALSSFDISMIVLSIGSGSIMISHINDSYFWIVTNKTNLTLQGGLKYFSIMSIFQGLGTFIVILFLVLLFG